MIYVKIELADSAELRMPLYEDEIFSACPQCGKEAPVHPEHLIEILKDKDSDFPGTSVYCDDCSLARHEANKA